MNYGCYKHYAIQVSHIKIDHPVINAGVAIYAPKILSYQRRANRHDYFQDFARRTGYQTKWGSVFQCFTCGYSTGTLRALRKAATGNLTTTTFCYLQAR